MTLLGEKLVETVALFLAVSVKEDQSKCRRSLSFFVCSALCLLASLFLFQEAKEVSKR